ncbi:MAG: GNAT family N-acetyltransferase [Candidatus Thorarchaeota archaeon]|nr:GNAT family N-acetyltransferase [Candidatus Thorarchaeota archaeon]
MTYRMRNYHYDDDIDEARRFLGNIFNLSKKHYALVPSRLENERHGPCGSEEEREDDSRIRIWEYMDENSALIAALTLFESNGYFWINVHPDHENLVRKLIPAVEEQWKQMRKNDEEELKIGTPVPVSFKSRIKVLQEFEYEDGGVCEHNQVWPNDTPPPVFQAPEGYIVRHVKLPEDFEPYSEVVNTVFSHCGMTEKLAMLYTEAGFYHDELDLVTEAPDGSFASFVTVRIDPLTRMAELEPVGTHPDHRRRGLGKAVCAEGIRRVQKYNPTCIVILGAAPTEAAAKLYESLGFIKEDVHLWKKTL